MTAQKSSPLEPLCADRSLPLNDVNGYNIRRSVQTSGKILANQQSLNETMLVTLFVKIIPSLLQTYTQTIQYLFDRPLLRFRWFADYNKNDNLLFQRSDFQR